MEDVQIIRLPDVMRKTGASKPTLYKWMREDRFPKPIKIGARAVGWFDSEVNDWIKSRPRAELFIA